MIRFETNPAVGTQNPEVEYRLISMAYRGGYQIIYEIQDYYEEWSNGTDRYVPIVTAATDSFGRRIEFEYNTRPFTLYDELGDVIDQT